MCAGVRKPNRLVLCCGRWMFQRCAKMYFLFERVKTLPCVLRYVHFSSVPLPCVLLPTSIRLQSLMLGGLPIC